MKRIKHHSKKSQGMSFIEVLIAMVIMVTGILGAVAMQATAKKGSFDAMQRSLASSLAQDIIERMRSNDATALVGYNKNDYGSGAYSGSKVANCTSIAGCSSAEMLSNDQYEWDFALMGADITLGGEPAGGLVDTRGCITVDGAMNNQVTIVISWQGRTETVEGGTTEGCGTAGDTRRQVLVEAFIY